MESELAIGAIQLLNGCDHDDDDDDGDDDGDDDDDIYIMMKWLSDDDDDGDDNGDEQGQDGDHCDSGHNNDGGEGVFLEISLLVFWDGLMKT